ncbi:TerD family protein [Niallia taxi]|uniref:TerD family protein n=1 Tax=Niallia taxi TaxID=2499688 RepID=UPI002934708D|nr:TerD family protein [Niallia taxi]WOD62929.1 TerD family protein [Niallia taxi]
MGVMLSKGQKVDLTKSHPGLSTVTVGLGWDINQMGADYDLDASAFLLGGNSKVLSDQDFIFYNNPNGAGGSVIYSGDNRTGIGHQDDEQIRIDLNRVPPSIQRVAFTITIHNAYEKGQNFGHISNAYVRIVNEGNQTELIRFNLGREYTVETAIVAAELYRHNGEWKFNAIGSGFQGGLAALCRNFGVTVDDEPAPQNSFNAQPQSFAPPAQNQPYYDNTNTYSSSFPASGAGSFAPSSPPPAPAYGQAPVGGYQQQGYGHSQPPAGAYGDDNIICPRCSSTNVRTGEKGFGLGKAAIGGLILGPIGLLGGFIGKNQLKFTCNSCGNNWSPSNTDYAEWGRQQKQRAKELFMRFKSPDVLDAVVASCALVSMADGRLDPAEERKMMGFIHQSEELRVFDINKVQQQFNHFVRRIEYDQIVGRAEAFRALGKVRSKPEVARLVARYCISIGYADGHFDQREKQTVAEICQELGLNPNEFLS